METILYFDDFDTKIQADEIRSQPFQNLLDLEEF